MQIIIREAVIDDIKQIQLVRNLVTENVLSDPSLVPDSDYVIYLNERGKGWVCEIYNQIVGFSIVDLKTIIYGRCLYTLTSIKKVLAGNCMI